MGGREWAECAFCVCDTESVLGGVSVGGDGEDIQQYCQWEFCENLRVLTEFKEGKLIDLFILHIYHKLTILILQTNINPTLPLKTTNTYPPHSP